MVELFFYVFATMAVGSALGVVLARNPVASLLFMVVSLASVAGIFVLLEAHFLAAVQVIVYAGAIMVLFLFVIMLLNLGHDQKSDLRVGAGLVVAFAVAGGALWAIQRGLGRSALPSNGGPGGTAIDGLVEAKGVVGAIADPLFTTYAVAFELTGLLLTIAVVGAIALAKRRV